MSKLLIPTYDQWDFPSKLQNFFEEKALICNPEVLTNERARVRMWARLVTLGSLNEMFWALQDQPNFFASFIEDIWTWRFDKIKEKLPDISILQEMFSEEKLIDIQDEEDEIKETITYHLIEMEEKFLAKTLFSELKEFEIERLFCYDRALYLVREEEEYFETIRIKKSNWIESQDEDEENDEDETEEFDLESAINEQVRNMVEVTSSIWISNRFRLDF